MSASCCLVHNEASKIFPDRVNLRAQQRVIRCSGRDVLEALFSSWL